MGESLNKLWQSWEIRLMVLSSLSLQIFLLAFAWLRRSVVSIRMSRSTSSSWWAPRGIILHWFLWLSYLSADFVATAALGYLAQYEDSNDGRAGNNRNKHLLMFWAPFLLLHLGGQDTITALSIEDNELWLRHLLTLITEVGFAVYVYGKSNPIKGGLWPAAIPMFIAGILKYAERTWSLQRASMAGLWNSVINVPDPNPNHAMLMEEYAANREAGLPAKIISVDVTSKSTDDPDKLTKGKTNGKTEDGETSKYLSIASKAFQSFQMFKGLFVDLIMSLENWEESQKIFKDLENNNAYRMTEIELLLMYEMLHSKADLQHTWKGCAFRAVTLLCTMTALCIFAAHRKSGFGHIEIAITYVLLVGAVVLELVSVICMHVSIWTLATLVKSDQGQKLSIALLPLVRKVQPVENSLWSNQMGQFNLVDFAFTDKPCLRSKIMEFLGLKERWDHYRYTTCVPVSKDVKSLVLDELKSKMKMAVSDHRGQWTLLLQGHYNKLSWSVDCEFEKSILIWHIATDLLFKTYNSPGPVSETSPNPETKSKPEVGQHISNYMLFLLILRPYMLPAGIGKIRFQGTCAEARKFFTRIPGIDSPQEKILGINTDHLDPSETTDSMSVLFAGSKLAHDLKDLFLKDTHNIDAMWELINAIWVEMLCFAANKCRGQFHAKQMSQGGEFLTIVWMLMAHLGLGDQCKVEVNPIVKLVVEK